MEYIRLCPACNSERPVNEMYCQNTIESVTCSWLLMNVKQTPIGGSVEIQKTPPEQKTRYCENGHEVGEQDFMCMECGADIQETAIAPEEEIIQSIGEYTVIEIVKTTQATKECFLVKNDKEEICFLTLYHENYEPDKAIYNVLQKADIDHVAALIETGYWDNRFFEVTEQIKGGALDTLDYVDENQIEKLVDEIGRALRDFSEVGMRHRDLSPQNILIRNQECFDLVIIDFSSARLSDYDLDTDTPLELTRYTAPEAIIGGISPASDWWSLGMIVLEQITKGAFFENINDKAFMIHLVTRGVELPTNIDERLLLLLKGLLCRDPLKRWHWEEVDKWLKKEYVAPPIESSTSLKQEKEKKIILGDETYVNLSYFALAAAEEKNWKEGLELFTSGKISNWVKEIQGEDIICSSIRNLRSKEDIDLEWRFSLALMHLNDALPLTWRGQIIIPAWLLSNPIIASQLIEGEIPDYLDNINREKWLVHLKRRRQNVVQKAKSLEIDIDKDKFKINTLSTSKVRLKSEMDLLRQIYPDAKNIALSDLMGDIRLSEEDLILMVSAEHQQFVPIDQLVKDCIDLAEKIGIDPDVSFYRDILVKPRIEIYELLNNHLEGFSKSNNESLNRWADRFRIQKRLSLLQSVLCLSIPKSEWITPPKHEYASSLLRFFEKKIIYASSRGPLVRLIISKNSARIDINELGTSLKSSEKLMNSILNRSSGTETVDPMSFSKNPLLHYRTRRMLLKAANYKRDTGLESLYMGFPFLISQVKTTHRPRVLPILLWPVALELKNRAAPTLEVGFDKIREEVRLNPALSSSLEEDQYKRIKEIYQEILGRQTLSISEVIDAFGSYIQSNSIQLTSHPEVTYKLKQVGLQLYCSAVFFNANFTGQAISEDLRLLQKLPHTDIAMEPILKITTPEIPAYDPIISESDRYTVVPVDPSQEKAVMQSRSNPGIVIEGPPGTGKSQTIVNIISDCIGRKEKVLVVSQKRAAIQVIMKRLEAAEIENRALTITDITKDRQPIIQSIREQVSHHLNKTKHQNSFEEIKRQRANLTQQIDRIEAELNVLSQQIHKLDDISGISYRNILSELIEIQSKNYIDVPEVRNHLENNTVNELNVLEEQISGLINDWIPSKYEENSLINLQITQYDEATQSTIYTGLKNFYEVEEKRVACIKQTSGIYDNAEAQFYESWLRENEDKLLKINNVEAENAKNWFDLIYDEFNEKSTAEDISSALSKLLISVQKLIADQRNEQFTEWLKQALDKQLDKTIRGCDSYLRKSKFKILNPLSWIHNFRLKKILSIHQLQLKDEHVKQLKIASVNEVTFRDYQGQYQTQMKKLNVGFEPILEDKLLAVKIGSKLSELLQTIALAQALKSCPLKNEARNLLRTGDKKEYKVFIQHLRDSNSRYQIRKESYKKLNPLAQWLEPTSYKQFEERIKNNDVDVSILEKMQADMAYFIPYQKFRIRLGDKKNFDNTLKLLALFRKYDQQIQDFPSDSRSQLIRKTIRREGLLGWKQRIEKRSPALLMAESDIEQGVKSLDKFLSNVKEQNKKLLNLNYDFEKIGTKLQWNSITKLRGKNYKKLREFIHLGEEIGLMDVRPIWLMSPEVVSQSLPLQAGMFDVVIFDEASQMLIEHAIPSLYRAKRAIISGDEKQMPPAGFFAHKIATDDDDDIINVELSEDNSEEELASYEDAWNKKEVKDCPDLLTLAKTVLPTTTLQIHYRSQYKALINFSNHAFYSGQLHVPAYHPIDEIEKIKPLEVIRVDGIYNEQTNSDEADALIQYLSDHWQLPENKRLSTGIVTFNKKQSELIEGKIEEKALNDQDFMARLLQERNKQQEGEDMGFFIKNVENVQGDERDMILFSTTFGHNKHGVFRRNFGALGHRGGERRLNVAITRARYKVIIATSMPINDISDMLSIGRSPSKPRDYIQAYLNFAETHSNTQIQVANKSIRKLSLANSYEDIVLKNDGFKNTVKNYIKGLGYDTVENSDYNVFYVDLAIQDQESGRFVIGIECDAPNNELLKNARYRELWRPQVLKKSIPVIHRTTSYRWFQDTEGEKKRLEEAIKNALNSI
ncbi:protein kinase domain-containing protein [Aquimarina algiphila]|uniref:protein kinase domain-containing protein n=1 Tax=Aquimarina algiphila TaxID=2047982 RepID=UPI00232B37C4|nr:AAA domain-containing protein [Aquimarina algiphila]